MLCVPALKSVAASTSKDLGTCAKVFKNGWPVNIDQKNEIILAALRILCVRMIAGATVIAFSAVYFNGYASIPKIVAIAASTTIMFHDIYIGSSNISKSMSNHQFNPIFQTNISKINLSSECLLERSDNIAKELTKGMWAMSWILIKIRGFWVPKIAGRFYNKKTIGE